MSKTDLQISPYSKIKVDWTDRSENYSKENKTKVRNHFANKYGISKNNVNVFFKAVKFSEDGDMIEVTGANIDNILDNNYQRELMKEWIKRENKIVDFDRIIKLDEKVNAELNIEPLEVLNKKWGLKWLMIDNFLSFGEENYLSFSKLKGLTIVNSFPKNMGGKTTLTIDSIKFLLHGSTTKTEKNEEIFNRFTDKNELTVRGMIEVEDEEIIIERKMRRSAKKSGGWNINNKVNYYRILPDGTEELLNDEDAPKTTKKIAANIGSEKDFEMLALATEKNLDDLIGLTTTESGKLLSRLIGLEILEMKEVIVRRMFNEFDKKKKSNQYDIITLGNDIIEHNDKIENLTTAKEFLDGRLSSVKEDLVRLSAENDLILNNRQTIDVTISELNPENLEKDIKTITDKGLLIKEKIIKLEAEILAMGIIEFDELKHNANIIQLRAKNNRLAVINSEIIRLRDGIQSLIKNGICQSCNRKLDNINNTEHISRYETQIKDLEIEQIELTKFIKILSVENDELELLKKSIDVKNRLELDKDRADVELGGLRNQITAKKNDLKKYNLNLEIILLNRGLDIQLSKVKTDIVVAERTKEDISVKIQKVIGEIKENQENVINKEKLIDQIKKENEIDKIYKVYIDLIGKKGIGKLVLRSVLPIINSELQRLLDDVCDFDIEIFIDDKNDVQFLMIKDEVINSLKSGSGYEKTAASIALRAVLGKISTLPSPNFITFDEVLGKVANDFLERLNPLFDKVKEMYEIVFLITHNDLVKDWSDTIITVIKENNISKILIN